MKNKRGNLKSSLFVHIQTTFYRYFFQIFVLISQVYRYFTIFDSVAFPVQQFYTLAVSYPILS